MGEFRVSLDILARNLGELWPFAIALALAAISISGRFSVTATQILLFAAWLVVLLAQRDAPWPYFVSGAILAAVVCIGLAAWFRPETIPLYFGKLIPKRTILFSSDTKEINPVLEIGDSGTKFLCGGPNGQPMFVFFKDSTLTIERIRSQVKVSTVLRDERGDVVAELIRNEWKVTPEPKTFDRNYSQDALEVKNARGLIVLQVKALPDRIQIQEFGMVQTQAFLQCQKLRTALAHS